MISVQASVLQAHFSGHNSLPGNETPAGPARQGGRLSPFWRRVEELLKLRRLHGSSDEILNIAKRHDIDDSERIQELERLAEKTQGRTNMLSTQTQAKPNLTENGLSVADIARSESTNLAIDIRRQIMSRPQHIQMLAVSKVLAELIADTVINRQLGPVEGLLEKIEDNLDFDDGTIVRQYARGLAELAENIRCRLANL